MAHLTCAGSTIGDVEQTVDRLKSSGIENILALRGDPPKESASKDGPGKFTATPGGFPHASDLLAYLTSRHEFDVGGACYPEKHLEPPNHVEDMKGTRHKVEQGAQFLISQLFFDNEHYWSFVEHARKSGIQVPIVPGIMPITNVAQVERFTKLCGASIPRELNERLRRVQDDP